MTAHDTPEAASPADGGRGNGRRREGAASAAGLPLLGALVAVVAWWAITTGLSIDKFLVPSPLDVVDAFLQQPGYLMEQTWVTLVETLQGFGLAILLGVPFAMLVAQSRLVERMVYPLLLAVNAVPKVAVAPILVIWMGFGQGPKVTMVVLLCFFPIVLATVAGLRSTPAELVELAASLDAGALKTFVKFRFPYALAQIFTGLKTAISLAVIGAVIAEFVGASAGLGFIIVQSGASANTPLAFAAMALLATNSIVLFYALLWLEKRMIPWAEEDR